MKDRFGRDIHYLRLSLTSACSLHCAFCRKKGEEKKDTFLPFDAAVKITTAAAGLGITDVRLTGGEPLLYPDLIPLIREISKIPGIRKVSMTTNGLLLPGRQEELKKAGLYGVNISLPGTDHESYQRICGADGYERVLDGVCDCLRAGMRTKTNTVLLPGENPLPAAEIARDRPIDVRFIEMMPLGEGRRYMGVSAESVLASLREMYGEPVRDETKGSGPAVYFRFPHFAGRIGVITAMSHAFCASCDRIRVTSEGTLKGCLAFREGISLIPYLGDPEALAAAIFQGIQSKPEGHDFALKREEGSREILSMREIGG